METHNHSHLGDISKQNASRLALSLAVTAGFVILEAAAGVFSNSLALLTDAAHNFTDAIALALSWHAMRVASQPSNAKKTFGYHRMGILVAMINSTTLALIAFGIFYEAYHRFISPPEVKSGVLIGMGLVAFVINLVTAQMVKEGSQHDLNMRSAFVHLMGDVLSTIGAVIAGIVIYFTGWNVLDPLVSVLIGLLILWNAWGILRETVNILLEATPNDVDLPAMVKDILAVKGVLGVHDLHAWSITQSQRSMSAHIVIEDVLISTGTEIQREISDLLMHRYNISHATLQLECSECSPNHLYCDITETNHSH